MASAIVEVVLVARDLHAAAAAAGRRLDDHRIADFGGDALGFLLVGDGAVGAGHDRNAEPLGGALGLDLVAHDADMVAGGADEGDVVGGEDVGELGILRQEAVARMHGVRAGDLAGRDDLVDVEIAVARRRRADAHALVGEAHMHGVGVGGRMDDHRLDAELLGRAQHPQRDLAAIGDEDFLEHSRPYSMTTSGLPYSTGCASSNRIAVTVPARGDGIWFIVFIASMISSVWPSLTSWPTSTKGLASGEGGG